MYHKLRTCPFCGGHARLETHMRTVIKGNVERVAYVYCTVCNARTERVRLSKYDRTSHSDDAESEAVNRWNSRVDV